MAERNCPIVKFVGVQDLNYKGFGVTSAMSPLGGHLDVLQGRPLATLTYVAATLHGPEKWLFSNE